MLQSRESQTAAQEFDGYIDLGRELSLLHSILAESVEKLNSEAAQTKLSKLSKILEEISEVLTSPVGTLRKSKAEGYRIYDNVTALRQEGKQNYADADLSGSSDPSLPPKAQPPSEQEKKAPRRVVSGSYAHGSQQGAAADLTTTDDYVMFSALTDKPSAVQAAMTPLRLNEQEVNQSWSKIVNAANLVTGDSIDLVSFMDELENANSSAELDNGSQVSIGQLSTIASSGYQSFGYSQSSSPVDCGVQGDPQGGQPLSFANPLFGHSSQTGTMSSTASSTNASSRHKARTASSSSVSSEESSPAHSSHHPHATKGALPPLSSHPRPHVTHDHSHRQLSKTLSSSSSCESLNKCLPTTKPENGRPLANGVSSSYGYAPDAPLSHSESVSHMSHSNTMGSMRHSQKNNMAHSNTMGNMSQSQNSNMSHSNTMGMTHSNTMGNLSQSNGQNTSHTPYQSSTWGRQYKGPLSRSVDLGQPSRTTSSPIMYHSQPPPPSPHHYKQIVTETLVIPPSPASPAMDHAPVYGPRRQVTPQNTVRMGVRSVQRRHDNEKTKSEVCLGVSLVDFS